MNNAYRARLQITYKNLELVFKKLEEQEPHDSRNLHEKEYEEIRKIGRCCFSRSIRMQNKLMI